jgi:uncharacterized protein
VDAERNENLEQQSLQPSTWVLARMHPIAFAALALGIIFILYQLLGGAILFFLSGGKITIENVEAIRWATLLGQILLILIPTLMIARKRGANLREYLRWRLPSLKEGVLVVVAVLALQQLMQGYMMLQDAIPLPDALQRLVDMMKSIHEQAYLPLVRADSYGELFFVVVVIALVPAFAEEILFRGVVQRSFEEAMGDVKGAILAGIVFAFFHIIPYTMIPLAMFGIFLGFIVYRSDSIVIGVLAHFINNFTACLTVFLHLNEDMVAIAIGSADPDPLLLVLNYILFAVVFVVATSYYVVVTRRSQ